MGCCDLLLPILAHLHGECDCRKCYYTDQSGAAIPADFDTIYQLTPAECGPLDALFEVALWDAIPTMLPNPDFSPLTMIFL